jgi:outer membrane receptor protein involved in Fe transport
MAVTGSIQIRDARAQEAAPAENEADRQSQTSGGGAATTEEDVWAGVEVIVVTGSSAADLLADLSDANSVTAFDAEALEAIGATDISDIAAFTPNLEIVTAGATSPTLFIRGIGLNDFNANAAGAVGVFQDNVAINSPALQLGTLFDIETTNVLRGPQGTGPNRNASAGAIKIYSQKPTGDFGARLKFDYGNYDLVDVEGALQFPVYEDVLAGRVAFRLIQRDGIMRNRCSGAPPPSERTPRPGGTDPKDPQWSYCGESVNPNEVSNVDTYAPKYLNNRDNWAARGMLRFQPEVDWAEMDWLLLLRGSHLSQYSTVGQAIGTVGTQRFPGTGEPNIRGLLGGLDQGGFRDQDLERMREAAADKIAQNICDGPFSSCSTQQKRTVNALRDQKIARDLARQLDIDPWAGDFSHSGKTRNEIFGLALNGDVAVGDVTLNWVTGYDQWNRLVDIDLDMSANTLFETRTKDRGYQVYQELGLLGDLEDWPASLLGGPIEWNIGGYFLYEDLDVRVKNDFGDATGIGNVEGRKYSQKVASFAGYAGASWDIFDDFVLDGGVRYNWERREIDYLLFRSGPPLLQNEDIHWDKPTGTVRITYQAGGDASIYAKYTRGWKTGTFNATGSNRVGVAAASPETIDAFEVGMRGHFFDDRIDLYAAFFHYSYEDYQLFTSQSNAGAPPEFVILNAPDVELYGSEVESTLTPWEGGVFIVRFAWLEGEFLNFVRTQLDDIPDPANPLGSLVVQREIDDSGNRLLNAPRFTVNLSFQQTFELPGNLGTLTPRYDGTWKDDTYFDSTEGRGIPNVDEVQFLPPNTIGQQAYWLHNVRLTYRTPDGQISVAGWVRNIANQRYKTFAADVTTFQGTTLYFVGDPRTYGLSASFTY